MHTGVRSPDNRHIEMLTELYNEVVRMQIEMIYIDIIRQTKRFHLISFGVGINGFHEFRFFFIIGAVTSFFHECGG